MYKIEIDKMCRCAKDEEKLIKEYTSKEFKSKEEAEWEALKLANHANANWCKKHRFYAYEEDSIIRIAVELSCPKEV
ncbi:MAG: hypothetical protein GXO61_00570 [Epsilonproteobacteria bacterium]|nr:hypothetical protein [Campylobacterota bacterium]